MQRVLSLSRPFQSGIGETSGKRRWEQKPLLEGGAGRRWGVPRRWERQQRALHGPAGAATRLSASFEIMPVTCSVIRSPPWLFGAGGSPYAKRTFHLPTHASLCEGQCRGTRLSRCHRPALRCSTVVVSPWRRAPIWTPYVRSEKALP